MNKLNIKKIVERSAKDHNETFSFVESKEFLDQFSKAFEMVYETIDSGGCILTCGNGGSFSDAQHFTAELVVRYKRDRPPLSSVTLGCNHSIFSACANDYSYEEIFIREYQSICKSNDTLIAISTSGNSPNIRKIVNYATGINRKWILLTSNKIKNEPKGGIIIKFPFTSTAAVQESHIFALQLLCRSIDDLLLGSDLD